MSNKFEKLLDLLVNEEMDQANALFHEIVVEKSREIYENLIAEEAEQDEMEEGREEDDTEMEEASEDEDESVEEGFMGQDDESVYEIGGEGDEMPPQDGADDMLGDVEDDSMGDMGGDDMGGDGTPATKGDIEDLKMDIDQDFAEIKAAFQQMIDGTSPDDEMGDDEFGGDDMGGDDMGDEEDDVEFGGEPDDSEEDDSEEDDSDQKAEEAFMREYREVVGKPYAGGKVAGKTEASGANTKSVGLQNPARLSDGKVDAGNIAQSATGADKKPGVGGVLKSGGKFVGGGTHNVDGVKSGIKTVKKVPAGHGAEKKGGSAGPVGSGKGDKAGQTDVKKIPQFLKPAK